MRRKAEDLTAFLCNQKPGIAHRPGGTRTPGPWGECWHRLVYSSRQGAQAHSCVGSVQAECSGEHGAAEPPLPLGSDETCKCAYVKRSHTIKSPGKAIDRTALAKRKMF